jgi:uncharacterized alpha/beta hydrolase family protein
MWSDKKFIIIIVLLIVAIAVGGTLGGIALTRGNNNSGGQVRNVGMNNITGLLQPNSGNSSGIQGLIKDFEQARLEIKSEGLDAYLQQLVKDGKITQEQADKIKSWFNARQNTPPTFGNRGRIMPFGGMRPGFGGGNRNNVPAPGSGNNTHN